MNNFTKTEALPKSGHVNEVCKEWLVREDGALAYKLQSQEISDFYKGNRFRNAVVREDFPTALHEQIKEHEHAEKQTEAYRRRLLQQEEHDKRVANEIAEKLERDLREQQQRELQESELMAQQMQEIYVNLPAVPPPSARDKHNAPPPPRPAKASTLQQQLSMDEAHSVSASASTSQSTSTNSSTGSARHQHSNNNNNHSHHSSFTSNTDGYVGLCLAPGVLDSGNGAAGGAPQRNKPNQLLVSAEAPTPAATTSAAAAFNLFVERSRVGRTAAALTNDNFIIEQQQQQFTQQQQQHFRHQHVASAAATASNAAAIGAVAAAAARRNVFDFINAPSTSILNTNNNNNNNSTPQTPSTHTHTPAPPLPLPLPQQASALSSHALVEELIEYSDVADSVRRYTDDDTPDGSPTASAHRQHRHRHEHQAPNFNRLMSPSHENLLRTDQKFQKLSPEKYDQLVGNQEMAGAVAVAGGPAAERHMQQHADDIELYVDPCDYASLRECGLPLAEIKEMSKKLKQEQKDALLARRLQELESHDGFTQEERDRLLAIEAQDKELAKMLQEREKAKAKRAKEKSRLRKTQQKDTTSSCSSLSGLHCGPLLPLPQDCLAAAKHALNGSAAAPKPHSTAKAQAQPRPEEPLDMEAYSNPIDIINGQRMQHAALLNNGSLTRETAAASALRSNGVAHARDDDIYTLPVDSCRAGQRPASLAFGGTDCGVQHGSNNNSMTRSENYSLDSQQQLQLHNGHDVLPSRLNYSKSSNFGESGSPTPPYMPIQGTRRSNSSEDRKKKSKDKCTHQ